MNFVEARDAWKANDGWEFADRDTAWNYFFTAGMVASDEIHKPLAQQAADWYALYADRATKERAALKEITSLREENAELRQLLKNMEAARDAALRESMRLRNENFALRQLAKPETRRIGAEPLQKLGARLAELLDEDQWAECEGLLLAAGVTPASGETHGHC